MVKSTEALGKTFLMTAFVLLELRLVPTNLHKLLFNLNTLKVF
jgi:membrane protein required for beta-lactamase induction